MRISVVTKIFCFFNFKKIFTLLFIFALSGTLQFCFGQSRPRQSVVPKREFLISRYKLDLHRNELFNPEEFGCMKNPISYVCMFDDIEEGIIEKFTKEEIEKQFNPSLSKIFLIKKNAKDNQYLKEIIYLDNEDPYVRRFAFAVYMSESSLFDKDKQRDTVVEYAHKTALCGGKKYF